jgi:transcriptional regulator with GAF, ATPase, and Fis domain
VPNPFDDPTRPEALGDRYEHGARLFFLWKGGGASLVLTPTGSLTIGRSSECDVPVDHPSVSRMHAVVHGGVPAKVEDLGSSNGVRVRGVRIEARTPTPFFPGDVVELGSVVMVMQASGAASPSSTPSADVGMDAVARLIDLVAKSEISVLLLGETGVGKSFVADKIHHASPRAAKALVRFNCAAFPDALLESELFGYERGAFTGAVQAKQGLLEAADGGTVFLDEIGEMPQHLQAKLLTVLETREVTRLGGLKPRAIDVRFIAATNRDLPQRIASGAFREDLYFRLNGIPITLPALRERASELPVLAKRFLDQACAKSSRAPLTISQDAMASLAHHTWPGNLRELRNTMERAAVLATGDVVLPEHLFVETIRPSVRPDVSTPAASAPPGSLRNQVDAFERQRVIEALEKCNGNQTEAAKLLGTSRRALINRIEAYGLPRPRARK